MRLTVTIPTAAADVRPDQTIVHEAQAFDVDEVSLLTGELVRIALRRLDGQPGRRRMVELSAGATVRVLPTHTQADHLAAVIADALGGEWTTTWMVAENDCRDIETEALGVAWNADKERLEHDPDENTAALLTELHEYRAHSEQLNLVGWHLAVALGDVEPGEVETVGNVPALLERLIADRDEWHRLATEDQRTPTEPRAVVVGLDSRCTVSGELWHECTDGHEHRAAVTGEPMEGRIPTTVRAAPAQQLDPDPDGAGTAAAIVGDDDICGASLLPYVDCDGDHVHIRAKGEVLDGLPVRDADGDAVLGLREPAPGARGDVLYATAVTLSDAELRSDS